MKTKCSFCVATFECGYDSPDHACWCKNRPPIPVVIDKHGCVCEKCFDLRAKNMGSLSCFRMHISYVGTQFSGFQAQANGPTIEAELKKALSQITAQQVKMIVAGRTDKGVHARGQVVSVQFFTRLDPRKLTLALRSKLPPEIAVWRIDKMPLGFDARRHSIGKQYVYRIFQGLVADPFSATYALHVRETLDRDAMACGGKYFLGEHDFSSFRSSLCTSIHAVRFIWHVGIKNYGPLIEIDIRGNAFCLNMVRIMVGTLIEVGKGKRSPKDILNALLAKDRTRAGITAKAHGLSLEKVYYPDDLSEASIPDTACFPRYPIRRETWGYDKSEIIYGPI